MRLVDLRTLPENLGVVRAQQTPRGGIPLIDKPPLHKDGDHHRQCEDGCGPTRKRGKPCHLAGWMSVTVIWPFSFVAMN